MRFEITVELKKEVLDAEGRAIRDALKRAGATHLKDVTVSKRYVIEVDPKSSPDPAKYADKLARDYLANPVSETFQVKKLT